MKKRNVIAVAVLCLAAAALAGAALFANVLPPSMNALLPNQKAVRWDYAYDGVGWRPQGKAPECPPLAFESPVPVELVTSVLYPGQYRGQNVNRGDDYKPHGGFRFDGQTTNDVEVRIPFDGYVWRGTRYLANGEIQYAIDIINSCGVLLRFGHMLELAPAFEKLTEAFPEPKENDSRTTETPPVAVKKGDLLATKVGLRGNVFLDWGVYDLRRENAASQNAAYRELHYPIRWFAFHALCWLDNLPEAERNRLRTLPGADVAVGTTSDYCD